MSENMQELKRRMKSIESTEHITNAMRLVSASKYKKAKNVFDRTSAQIQEVSHTMGEIVSAALFVREVESLDEREILNGFRAVAKSHVHVV